MSDGPSGQVFRELVSTGADDPVDGRCARGGCPLTDRPTEQLLIEQPGSMFGIWPSQQTPHDPRHGVRAARRCHRGGTTAMATQHGLGVGSGSMIDNGDGTASYRKP